MKFLHSQIFGEGEPLLIFHGFLGMSDNWKTLGTKFAEGYEVHLIDQRNHGRSFHADEFSYEVLVDDLLHYIDHHRLQNVNLLGHSMGGKTAMFSAVNHPERVNKLVVADIGPRYYSAHHHDILEGLNAVDFSQVSSRKEIEEVLSEYVPEFGVRQFLLKNVYRVSKDEFGYRFNLKSLTENYDEVGVALPSLMQFDGETLFLRGENSGYIDDTDQNLIKAHFPNSQIATVKNAGHWLHAENPTDFYNEVVSFLAK
ncbi:MAG: alpha/beta fold hydrolase [Flavobacteriaceae bacterium]|nr:alpha/beta fold hydrolase [Flavobacteriaceae bacterium]